ncbi:acyl carrier protein [Anaerosphaera aminiphila DSM 21120]|uniref:Acyl carrier protein n=1 Tax=Anaerosphaera aminiphila DSM 21120 TaxID=1120995 RepID=A0A1M5RHG2_9FIRM|nr:acyl carrier protein [Anaerosphaera aminiphila]SHH25560.1 acyl carrier protein [Anaerosphaera aminiphila DSM 21120]
MRDKILELIATQFNKEVKELDDDMSFIDDLNADSIDIVEFVMTIEDELGIEINDDDIEKMSTIGDVIEYIEEIE